MNHDEVIDCVVAGMWVVLSPIWVPFFLIGKGVGYIREGRK